MFGLAFALCAHPYTRIITDRPLCVKAKSTGSWIFIISRIFIPTCEPHIRMCVLYQRFMFLSTTIFWPPFSNS